MDIKDIVKTDGKEVSEWIADLIDCYGNSFQWAITGQTCISRGITISSPRYMLTHAIFPSINDKDKAYQLAGRVSGNMKLWDNYIKPKVFCSKRFGETIKSMEEKAIQLIPKAQTIEQVNITHNLYKKIGNNKTTTYKYDYDNIHSISQWFDGMNVNPNECKPSECKAIFKQNSSGFWCHYDNVRRVFGDAPPGGRGRNSQQENKWVLVYKNEETHDFIFNKATYFS
mgnify:CR=1 FL=1